jgi:hypothetical protein
VQQAPGLPCALCSQRGQTKMQTSDAMRRENAKLYPRHCERSEAIHCHRMHRKMDCFAALAMTLKGRVLDRPSYGLADAMLRLHCSKAFAGTLLTGNGNSAGLSVLVQLACKLRDPRSRAPRK